MFPVYAWRNNAETNFGDELNGPLISAILGRPAHITRVAEDSPKLLAIGSVLNDRLANPGDVVWGAGAWGERVPGGLDVRAVRGPLTAAQLAVAGYDRPIVFGDPALLLPRYFDFPRGGGGVGYMPHHGDDWGERDGLIDPRWPPLDVAAMIAGCDLLITSSLHGAIVADAYGVPVVLAVGDQIRGRRVKYQDYFASVGRQWPLGIPDFRAADRRRALPTPRLPDLDRLLAAFPREFFD